MDIEHGEEPRGRRAGVLVISVWVDELGPGEFLAKVRGLEREVHLNEQAASETELLTVVRAWLRALTAHHPQRM